MSKFISELTNSKSKIGEEDFLIVDTPADGKTYKVTGDVFLPKTIVFSDETEVTISHSLNHNPLVFVADAVGNVIEGDIKYLDEETVQIAFNTAISGVVTYW